jgi:hypothetical protein
MGISLRTLPDGGKSSRESQPRIIPVMRRSVQGLDFFLQTSSNTNRGCAFLVLTYPRPQSEPMGLNLGKTNWNWRSAKALPRLGVSCAAGGHAGSGSGSRPGPRPRPRQTRMHSTMIRTVSATTMAQARVSLPSPGVLYVDRGVIVLNKPPGLVSQGTSRSSGGVPVTASTAAPTTSNPATRTRLNPPLVLASMAPAPPGSAFNDVLNGTNSFSLRSIQSFRDTVVVGAGNFDPQAPRIFGHLSLYCFRHSAEVPPWGKPLSSSSPRQGVSRTLRLGRN